MPSVIEGKTVIADRFDSSTNTYLGWAGGGNRQTIERFSKIVGEGIKPDAVILIRVLEKTALRRKLQDFGGDPPDRKRVNYTRRLVAAYDDMMPERWRDYNWHVVDGEKSVGEVTRQIC